MVLEKPRKPCIIKLFSGITEQLCSDSKTIYIREIKDSEPADKKVKTRYGIELRTYTKHKMRWVKVGTFCFNCHNINYDPAWLEANNKEHYDFYVRRMAFEERGGVTTIIKEKINKEKVNNK